ncbi:Stk1 family PASTA domain-containing Ser/Thr kinase [Halanaerobium hydrogeniformans]|uniref:non-specific serine/threonine protein kinase n=1 Tax=Halanaerobium hydrogeniformans TaxID=656519 RepID=E4RLT5_HALHG|nr:Stk1 family PASTA domain-containing Ser/Thr kinase [Halanaerobium hydrogeniformans]ADQ14999.1 serine/threonine protein kinase with PASTA sensor(s) [Halanaerobium hydrogeniformans]
MQDKILNNRYKIIEEIGRGGMAIVYSARDTLLQRTVAIKMLRPEYSSDNDFKEKFHQEARAVAKLSHPNVVSIYDIVVDDQKIYLVMEIVKGKTLKDLIKERGKLSIVEALEFASQIAAALSIAHGNQIVHCDIKPHNIILTEDMEVKITDFGISRAVNSSTVRVTDTVVGSAHYFSPEQAKGGEIKAYSDIYSLGIVLYEMITGELPFKGESPISVALKHIQEQPISPTEIDNDIPEEVNQLIMKAMAKDPIDRYNNAREMRHRITHILKNLKNQPLSSNKDQSDFNADETKIMKKSDFNLEEIANNSKAENSTNSKNKKQLKKELANKKKSKKDNGDNLNDNQENESLLKSLGSIIALVVVLAALFIGGGFYFFRSYTDVPIVEVPDIEGKSLNEARSLASEQGLSLREAEERVYSDDIAENHIVNQQPAGGSRVKQSRPINITVSQGSKLIEVPNFVDKTLRETLIELENLALKSGNIQYIFRLSVDPGTVINQIPAAGAEVESGSEITLFVSRGERDISVRMPDLTGLKQQEAFELIRESGLNIGNVRVEESNRFIDGQVISQSVRAGEYLPRGIAVDFVISRGSANNLEEEDYNLNRINVNVTGTDDKQVKIVVIDDNGEDEVYNALHQPGENVIRDIWSKGETEIKIYFDNQLIKTEKVGG